MFWDGSQWVSDTRKQGFNQPKPRRNWADWISTGVMLVAVIGLVLPASGVFARQSDRPTQLADSWSRHHPVTVYQESARRIAYSGRWITAYHPDYSGGSVFSTDDPDARATIKFKGTAIAWVGPVGPTRGQADISIDGEHVKTVDTWASTYRASAVLFRTSLTDEPRHTLTIVVRATAGHETVAIDRFIVRGAAATNIETAELADATAAPTSTPSAAATTSPTAVPTPTPTSTPSASATTTPTPAPTRAPTPTAVPTAAPTPPPPDVPEGTVVPAGSRLAAAIAALPSSGGVLILRGGNHIVSSPITTSKSFKLLAYPGETPVITHASARPDFLYLRGGPVLIEGITFKTGASSPTFDDSMGSALAEVDEGGHDVTFRDVTFIGTSAMSGRQQLLYIATSVKDIKILDCTFNGHGTDGSGIHMYHDPGPAGVTIRGNVLRNFAYEAAILVDQLASDILIESNQIDDSNIAIQYRKSLGAIIRNNHGDGDKTGLQVISSANLTRSGNSF